jgi:transcriptional regulator with XRE-family HTH domain
MEFHENLARLCRSRRIGRGEILEALNQAADPRLATSKATLGRWFTGESEPSIPQLVFIARFLGTTIEALCVGSDERNQPEPNGRDFLGDDEFLAFVRVKRLGSKQTL